MGTDGWRKLQCDTNSMCDTAGSEDMCMRSRGTVANENDCWIV